MSTKPKEASEGDVIVARALSSYAQLRAKITRWSGLPATPTTASGDADDEEEELFTAEPETAGVGYVGPQDGERTKTSTDNLRKQMLGKRRRDPHAGLERGGGHKRTAVLRNGSSRSAKQDQDSEEDEGRSAVGKKRKHPSDPISHPETNAQLGETNVTDSNSSSIAKKTSNSYLDEVLANRTKKRKKKQGNQNSVGQRI